MTLSRDLFLAILSLDSYNVVARLIFCSLRSPSQCIMKINKKLQLHDGRVVASPHVEVGNLG